jgi:hypothetical protein
MPPDRLAELLPDAWFQSHSRAARKRAAKLDVAV